MNDIDKYEAPLLEFLDYFDFNDELQDAFDLAAELKYVKRDDVDNRTFERAKELLAHPAAKPRLMEMFFDLCKHVNHVAFVCYTTEIILRRRIVIYTPSEMRCDVWADLWHWVQGHRTEPDINISGNYLDTYLIEQPEPPQGVGAIVLE